MTANSTVTTPGGINVLGVNLDEQTRCRHYHGERDIIAIRFKCCNTYYACYKCHETLTDHAPIPWTTDEYQKKAVLCGSCGLELTIRTYLESGYVCPGCSCEFNPGCKRHYLHYFKY